MMRNEMRGPAQMAYATMAPSSAPTPAHEARMKLEEQRMMVEAKMAALAQQQEAAPPIRERTMHMDRLEDHWREWRALLGALSDRYGALKQELGRASDERDDLTCYIVRLEAEQQAMFDVLGRMEAIDAAEQVAAMPNETAYR
jgi:uncharacterized protein YhaN